MGASEALLVRRRPIAATLVSLGTAWPVGILMLSLTAASFGIGIRAGLLCIDTSTPRLVIEDGYLRFYKPGVGVVATEPLGVLTTWNEGDDWLVVKGGGVHVRLVPIDADRAGVCARLTVAAPATSSAIGL